MVPTLPVQNHLDEVSFDAYDNLIESCTKDALARRRSCSRVRPGQLDIGTELHQVLTLPLAQLRGLSCLKRGSLALDSLHRLQCLVPTPLQFSGDQTIVGIYRIVLPMGMGGLVASLLQREPELPLCGRCLVRLCVECL